jgi:hypothetical protein
MRTLIVRVFEPAPGAGPVALRGVVEDVRSGTARPFRGEEQLLAALRQGVEAYEDASGTVGAQDSGDSYHYRVEHPQVDDGG